MPFYLVTRVRSEELSLALISNVPCTHSIVVIYCCLGNKRGVGHFVKCISWLDDHGKLQCHLLDLDASEGSAVDCAKAIQSSAKKLCLNGGSLAFKGQMTDSGGGGVLDNLARELRALDLCVPEEEGHQKEGYLVASCGIHCLQLQLSKPVNELIGSGGLNKRNAMQMLRSISDLQGHMEWQQVVAMMDHSQEWVDAHLDGYTPDPSNQGDVDFAGKFNKVHQFREFEVLGKQRWKLCPACVLTRWQWVGKAAQCGCKHYLVLLKFTQLCVNRCDSANKINKCASDLQSLLIEAMFYCDTALITSLHEAYFKDNIDWFVKSDDLTGVTGFQAHQMLIRYYIMRRDLKSMKTDMKVHNGFFHPFIRALDNIGDHGPLSDEDAQKTKALKWVDIALESLDKHFGRWASPELLPAALMAKPALAQVVARFILGNGTFESFFPDKPLIEDYEDETDFYIDSVQRDTSNATVLRSAHIHHSSIGLQDLEWWLQTTGPVNNWSDLAKQAAQFALDGNDLRKHDADGHPIVHEMWHTYLPLACQTQFVERGVWEAKLVASTGRLEEQRSACAIVRSFTLLVSGIERDTTAPDRIKSC